MDVTRRAGRVAAGLSLALFAQACVLPALALWYDPGYEMGPIGPAYLVRQPGWVFLLGGALAMVGGAWAWLANVALAVGWAALLLRRWWLALGAAVCALLAAGDLVRIGWVGFRYGVPLRGPVDVTIERPLVGCYLWLASMVIVAGGALWCRHLDRRHHSAGRQPPTDQPS